MSLEKAGIPRADSHNEVDRLVPNENSHNSKSRETSSLHSHNDYAMNCKAEQYSAVGYDDTPVNGQYLGLWVKLSLYAYHDIIHHNDTSLLSTKQADIPFAYSSLETSFPFS